MYRQRTEQDVLQLCCVKDGQLVASTVFGVTSGVGNNTLQGPRQGCRLPCMLIFVDLGYLSSI